MELAAVTIDVFVSRPDSWDFWEAVIGRAPDLRPDDTTAEWRLIAAPEVALRVRVDRKRAGAGRVGLGVADLDAALRDLRGRLDDVPEPRVVPGVIASAEVRDPDGNIVAVWQDLMARRKA